MVRKVKLRPTLGDILKDITVRSFDSFGKPVTNLTIQTGDVAVDGESPIPTLNLPAAITAAQTEIETAKRELATASQQIAAAKSDLAAAKTDLDQRLAANQKQVEGVTEQLTSMKSTLDETGAAVTAAREDATDLKTRLEAEIRGVASQVGTVEEAATAATTLAQRNATALLDLAGKTGRLITSRTAPTGTDADENNLWLDPSTGQLSSWDGSRWKLVTDARLTDAVTAAAAAGRAADEAAAAAAAARTTASSAKATADDAARQATDAKRLADAAQTGIAQAQAAADAAQQTASTADGRITVATHAPTASDGSGKPEGALWELRIGNITAARFVWTRGAWVQVKAGANFIGADAVGIAQIQDAAVGTAQIADLAVTNGKIGDLDVGKLTAHDTSRFQTAVVNTLLADEAFIRRLAVEHLIVTQVNLIPGVDSINDTTLTPEMLGLGEPIVLDRSNGTFTVPADFKHVSIGGSFVLRDDTEYTLHVEGAGDTPGELEIYIEGTDWISDVRNLEFFEGIIYDSTIRVSKTGEYRLFVDNYSGVDVGLRTVSIRPKVGAELIVDGAISAEQIQANSVAAAVGKFIDGMIENLTVTGVAHLKEAVADAIYTKLAVVDKLQATDSIITRNMIASGAINASKITVDTGLVNKLTAQHVWAGDVTGKTMTASRISGGEIYGAIISTDTPGNDRTYIDRNGLDIWRRDAGDILKIGHGVESGLQVKINDVWVALNKFAFGAARWSTTLFIHKTYAYSYTSSGDPMDVPANAQEDSPWVEYTPFTSNVKVSFGFRYGWKINFPDNEYAGRFDSILNCWLYRWEDGKQTMVATGDPAWDDKILLAFTNGRAAPPNTKNPANFTESHTYQHALILDCTPGKKIWFKMSVTIASVLQSFAEENNAVMVKHAWLQVEAI